MTDWSFALRIFGFGFLGVFVVAGLGVITIKLGFAIISLLTRKSNLK